MQVTINKGENNTYKADVVIEKSKVVKAFDEALAHEAKDIEIKGFRKGKAPLDVVKKNIDQSKLRSHALNHVLSEAYSNIIKENKLKPIVYPRFNITEFEDDKDLKFTLVIIEAPEIKLGDYKAEIAKIESKEKATVQQIIDAVLHCSDVKVASELITEETDRMMSSLIDQLGRLGLTIDKYMESQNKTPQSLRDEYAKTAENNIRSDFLITEIAGKEGVTISDEEVEKTISAIPDEASKKALSNPDQRMYIKAVLLKNKTIQKLAETK